MASVELESEDKSAKPGIAKTEAAATGDLVLWDGMAQ